MVDSRPRKAGDSNTVAVLGGHVDRLICNSRRRIQKGRESGPYKDARRIGTPLRLVTSYSTCSSNEPLSQPKSDNI